MSSASLAFFALGCATSARLQTGPVDDLLDHFRAEAAGQWARAQQEAVINRAKDRVVQQFRFCLRPQLACILASLQIGVGSVPPGTNTSVKELPKNAWLALALGD